MIDCSARTQTVHWEFPAPQQIPAAVAPAGGQLKLHGGRIEFLSKQSDAAQERFQLRGAVVGGGLQLANARHIRVADASTGYELPKGSFDFQADWVAQLKLPAVALGA